MGRVPRRLRALRVLERTSLLLESGKLQAEPAWYRVVGETLPATTLARTRPVLLHKPRMKRSEQKKQKTAYMPQNISYVEDSLRQTFYKDHPWELARPKILVEEEGLEYTKYDWSNIVQTNKALDGDSVVFRQLWLMEQEKMTIPEAYHHARQEFYKLREKEDIERRIAHEEAISNGAIFARSMIELGIEKEREALEEWKIRASENALSIKNRRSQSLPVFQESRVAEDSEGATEETA